jgi:hypothetical protein
MPHRTIDYCQATATSTAALLEAVLTRLKKLDAENN